VADGVLRSGGGEDCLRLLFEEDAMPLRMELIVPITSSFGEAEEHHNQQTSAKRSVG
jgi:hypothetical protein